MPTINRNLAAAAGLVLVALVLSPLTTAGASSASPPPTELGGGHHGDYAWTVKATRLVGSSPCVSVAITHFRGGPFDYDRSRFRDCVLAGPGLTRATPPLLSGGTHLGADGSRMTVYGILATGSARRVRATVSDGVDVARVSTSLQPVRTALAERPARGLRFGVIALSGSQCIERIATESGVGRALWQGAPLELECGAGR